MTKEQYLAIVASWKQYIQDDKHKKVKVPYDIYNWRNYGPEYGKKIGEAYDMKSNLTSIHHLIYTILRKKDINKAFSKVNPDSLKRKNGQADAISHGDPIKILERIDYILDRYKTVIDYAKPETIDQHYKDNIMPLLAPFGATMTLDLFKEIIKNYPTVGVT
jgi:hypothetical protein